MSESSRIVFSSFRSGGDPMLDSWNRFRVAVAPRTAGEAPKPGRTALANGAAERSGIWRLLASNNRELCRSAHVYPSFSAARSHVSALRERVDELTVTPVAGAKPGSRGWYMSLDGVIVITCGRWYGASASSAEAAAATLETLVSAVLTDEARPISSVSAGRSARG